MAEEWSSWRRQLSALHFRGPVDVVVGEYEEVEDGAVTRAVRLEIVLDVVADWDEEDCVVLVLDVDRSVEEDAETGVWETQRTWPMERSQLLSREGLKA